MPNTCVCDEWEKSVTYDAITCLERCALSNLRVGAQHAVGHLDAVSDDGAVHEHAIGDLCARSHLAPVAHDRLLDGALRADLDAGAARAVRRERLVHVVALAHSLSHLNVLLEEARAAASHVEVRLSVRGDRLKPNAI